MRRSESRTADLRSLAANSALAVTALTVLVVFLGRLDLITYTWAGVLTGSLVFFAVAGMNLAIRIAEAHRLGYQYYYEHSLAYALLSFVVNARFYGFFPVLYLGGTALTVDRLGRTGFADKGVNQGDLCRIASLPLLINVALATLLLFSSAAILETPGFILSAYTFFATLPWPRSNGLHILSYKPKRWLAIFIASAALTGTHAVL